MQKVSVFFLSRKHDFSNHVLPQIVSDAWPSCCCYNHDNISAGHIKSWLFQLTGGVF